jgi:RNA polymerase sigma factor (sigma-70 family)
MLFASKAFNNKRKAKRESSQAGNESFDKGSLWQHLVQGVGDEPIPSDGSESDATPLVQLSEAERLEIRNQRIQMLYPLVKSIARRVGRAYPKADVEELISDGCVGLIRAVDLFDPTRGVVIEAYARRLIIGAIFNGLRKRDPLTSRLRRALRETEEERYRLAASRGSMPTMAEMEQRDKKLIAVRTKAMQRSVVSLDAPLPSGMTIGASTENDPEAVAVERALVQTALTAINTLPARQREVMMLYYMGQVPLPAIAQKLGVTRQRASQIHREALKAVTEFVNTHPHASR